MPVAPKPSYAPSQHEELAMLKTMLSNLRVALASLGIAVAAVLLSTFFAAEAVWAGYATLAVLALLLFTLRARMGLDLGVCRVGIFMAALVVIPFGMAARYLPPRDTEGPFAVRPFAGEVAKLEPSERVPFRGGELVICNREGGAAPVVSYRVDGLTEWAVEVFVSRNGGAENQLREITPLRLERGVVRNRLDFDIASIPGVSRGFAQMWKWGAIQTVYLAW